MAKLGNNKSESNKDQIKKLILDALEKQQYSTAIFFSERLSCAASATIGDYILCAKCFLLAGEQRRCLATLQHRGLLQVSILGPLGDVLRPPKTSSSARAKSADFLTPAQLLHLAGVHLAACCLLLLQEHEDCLALLESLVHVEDGTMGDRVAERSLSLLANQASEIHVLAAIYCLVGKCYDSLDHRSRALRAFTTALRIDPACTEVAEYMCRRGMLSRQEKLDLLHRVVVLDNHPGKEWLQPFYDFTLGGEPPHCLDLICTNDNGQPDASDQVSALSLVTKASFLFQNGCMEDAFRVAAQAYLIDPYDWQGNLIYIGTMVNLSLKNELFYLGHELVHSHPKHAVSWYAVGCYYWACRKLELAQRYLQKTTKIDKRFSHAWVLLGHVLAAQEESEHAISAYRTACRVSPGDLHPQIAMAKELVRTSNFSLALHVLVEARTRSPTDATVLNELGVVYMQLNRLQEAMKHLRKAAELITSPSRTARRGGKEAGGIVEILSNYGTCLRKSGMLEQALEWYQRCLSYAPNDPMTHANMGFTLHLSRRFDEAVDQYHRALSLQPAFSFCADMLTQVLSDMSSFPASSAKPQSRGEAHSGGVFQQPHMIEALFLPSQQPAPQRINPPDNLGAVASLNFSRLNETPDESLVSQFSAVPQQDRSLDESSRFASPGSFQMRGGGKLGSSFQSFQNDDSPVYARDDERLRDASRSRASWGEGSNVSWDEDSVESYSRIAGRLSMNSTMSND